MTLQANPTPAALGIEDEGFALVLPSQHFAPLRQHEPEQRLMIAVLQDALDCVKKHRRSIDPIGRQLFHKAEWWFLANDRTWPYSFEHICANLDLDANAVRQRLRVAS